MGGSIPFMSDGAAYMGGPIPFMSGKTADMCDLISFACGKAAFMSGRQRQFIFAHSSYMDDG